MSKLLLAAALSLSTAAFGQNWDTSPYNWDNSPSNFNNSPYNFNNSPSNFNNSQYNWSRKNGLYDSSGNSFGYATVSPSGTVNFFSNDGTRFGYSR